MRHMYQVLNSRVVLRLAAAGLTAGLLAGCSSDANRLNNPFANPFVAQSDATPTNAIQAGKRVAVSKSVLARPLTSPASRQLTAPAAFAAPATPSPRAAAAAVATSAPETTSTISRPVSAAARGNGWSAEGGTPIVAAQGETSAMLARRYGVPEDQLLRVNGFSSGGQVQPGARLIVPVFGAGNAAPVAAKPQIVRFAKPSEPVAAKAVMAKKMVKPVDAPVEADAEDVAEAPVKAAPAAKPRVAAKPAAVVPAAKPVVVAKAAKPVVVAKPVVAAKPVAAPVKVAVAAPAKPVPAKPVPVKTAKLEKPVAVEPKKPDVDKTPVASLPPAAAAPAVAEGANPEFRWPARGRVIQGFKAGGNDGINIAVPEGTSVKAAEGGVVAYAGSELKGYGNLVLIRHPNGFVSAYANNGDIEVKRGDTVKRGQTIAKSGQSGNVSSPQLHFELRKGSTPVDPTNYLAGL